MYLIRLLWVLLFGPGWSAFAPEVGSRLINDTFRPAQEKASSESVPAK